MPLFPRLRAFVLLVFSVCSLPAVENLSPPPQANTVLERLAKVAEEDLRGNLLPYWLKHARNSENSGFFGFISGNNLPDSASERGALLTARILWTFSAAYRQSPKPEYLEMARYAYADLEAFFDREHGGLFWTLSASGKPKDTSKQVYVHTFGIYGLAEYYLATGDAGALEKAKALYRLIDTKAHDPINGGYFEVYSRDWKRGGFLSPRSVVGPNHPKSQNTNLHVLECLTNLLRAWPDEQLRSRLVEQIHIMQDKLVNPKTHHLYLYTDEKWTPVDDECSYGHDIEYSWLLCEAAEVAGGDALLEKVKPTAIAVAQATLNEGVDTDGGIWDTGTPAGVRNTRKDWWPQAEAVVGFLNAYQLSGDDQFLAAADKTCGFIEANVIDREGGEWFQVAHPDLAKRKRAPKVALWKCPYHNGRAWLEVLERTTQILRASRSERSP
ncbi:MAG: AGE family epimerase/isomerase [Opitutaceae bacterium]|nr:AGE family epimerase/isomerase [Opitutaceae bacterium]